MVPIWVMEPIGFAMPLRTASTPAINVVATAPRPTTMTPSFPVAGWISEPGAALWPPSLTVDISYESFLSQSKYDTEFRQMETDQNHPWHTTLANQWRCMVGFRLR